MGFGEALYSTLGTENLEAKLDSHYRFEEGTELG